MITEKEKIASPRTTAEVNSSDEQDQMGTWNEIRARIGSDIEAPTDRDTRVTVLGIALHELWLRTRHRMPNSEVMYADGRLEPRIKKTTDEDWVEAHSGVDQVDIASKFFTDLPYDWEAENLAAADVIDELVQEFGGAEHVNLIDDEVRQKCGEIIHNKWLERNTYAKGGDLDVPFAELPADEQAKDLVQLQFACELLKPDKNQEHPSPWLTRVWKSMNNWALDCNLPMRAIDGSWIDTESMYYRDQVDLRRAGLR